MSIKDSLTNLNSARHWYERGQALIRSKNYKEAVKAFNTALREDVEFAEAYLGRGACFYLLGKYRLASTDMDAAALLGCQDAQFWSRYESGLPEDSAQGDEGE